MYRFRQVHMGLWLITLHSAFGPHGPGQGDTHFWFLHDLSAGHSELTTHSGLQFGGEPWYSGKHEQTLCPLVIRHWLLEPQGDG